LASFLTAITLPAVCQVTDAAKNGSDNRGQVPLSGTTDNIRKSKPAIVIPTSGIIGSDTVVERKTVEATWPVIIGGAGV